MIAEWHRHMLELHATVDTWNTNVRCIDLTLRVDTYLLILILMAEWLGRFLMLSSRFTPTMKRISLELTYFVWEVLVYIYI